MPDLDERFRALARTSAPDVWPDASSREPRDGTAASAPGRRWIAAVVAFAVAAAGIGLAVWAFGGGPERRRQPIAPAASNGRIAYASDGNVWTIGPDGTDPQELTSNLPGSAIQPAWSPDGTRLVFVIESHQDAQPASIDSFDLYEINADGSGLTRLTTDGPDLQPSWSPDGTKIAYSHGTGPEVGTQDIWVMNADGSDPVALTHERSQALALSPSWSPNGSKILFVSNRTNTPQIYVMNADGTDQTQLTEDRAFHANPEYSPDETKIAFAGSDIGGPGIYVMNADGTGVEQLTHDAQAGPLNLSWSPDGTKIAYTTSPQANQNIVMYVLDPATKAITQIGPTAGQVLDPAWQPVPLQGSSLTPTPTETSPPSAGAHVVATIDIGPLGQTSSILYAEGSIWVTAYGVDGGGGADRSMVFRIDPATNGIVARIPVDAAPAWEIGGGGIAAGDGSIWVTGSGRLPGQGSGAVLDRIDPATNEVVATTFLGGSFGADVVVDGSGAWVLVFDADTSTEVLRLDPATGNVVARIGLDAEWAHRIFSAAGAIWVNVGGSTFDHGALVKIDPATDSIVTTLLNASLGTFDPGAGVIWTTAGAGGRAGLARIDPQTAQFLGDPTPVALAIRAIGLAEDSGGIWFEGYDDSVDGDAGSIERYDPATGEIDISVPTPKGGPLQMAVAPGSLWTVNHEGTVTRIDLG